MKKQTLALITLMAAMLASGSALAQTKSFRAEVPFAFVVGNQELPAGVYRFERLLGNPSADETVGIVALRNTQKHVYEVVIPGLSEGLGDPQPACKLVFHRHGGRHYLYQIWIAGDARSQMMSHVLQAAQVASDEGPAEEITLAQLH
jgi:hypothetical protein